MRLKLIACEVLLREFCDAVARSAHQVDVEFLPKGLHDRGGDAMREELQRRVDATEAGRYDAIAMGYALCGNGLHGLTARAVPIVAPRAHDCIALLMGSRQRYEEFFAQKPGTYFRSTGWLERGVGLDQLAMTRTGVGVELEQLIAKYGEDNGRYLYAELNRYQSAYSQLVYIHTGLEANGHFEERARAEAEAKQWDFEVLPGSLRLFHALVAGEWNEEDFLVVRPGERIVARYDGRVMAVERQAV
jgi:hypothetical protein